MQRIFVTMFLFVAILSSACVKRLPVESLPSGAQAPQNTPVVKTSLPIVKKRYQSKLTWSEADMANLTRLMSEASQRLSAEIATLSKAGVAPEVLAPLSERKAYYDAVTSEAKNLHQLWADLQKINDFERATSLLETRLNQTMPVLLALLQKSAPSQARASADGAGEGGDAELASLTQKMLERLNNKDYTGIIKEYPNLRDRYGEMELPSMLRFSYAVALYETGDTELALIMLDDLTKEAPSDSYFAFQWQLGRWLASQKKIDLALEAYGNVVDRLASYEDIRKKIQGEMASLEHIKTPLEEQVYALIMTAENNLAVQHDRDAATKSCQEALKLMDSQNLVNDRYRQQCDDLFAAIRQEEAKNDKAVLAEASTRLDQQDFSGARELLTRYLEQNPQTDAREAIATKMDEIDQRESSLTSSDCQAKISGFEKKYRSECLPQLEKQAYDTALPCLDFILREDDPECFGQATSIIAIKQEAKVKIGDLLPRYLQMQLQNAANLFKQARQSKVEEKQKEYFRKSYAILRGLQQDYPANPLQDKISRYIAVVVKEIKPRFPELLESANEGGEGGTDQAEEAKPAPASETPPKSGKVIEVEDDPAE
jgi:hypothetical protein